MGDKQLVTVMHDNGAICCERTAINLRARLNCCACLYVNQLNKSPVSWSSFCPFFTQNISFWLKQIVRFCLGTLELSLAFDIYCLSHRLQESSPREGQSSQVCLCSGSWQVSTSLSAVFSATGHMNGSILSL